MARKKGGLRRPKSYLSKKNLGVLLGKIRNKNKGKIRTIKFTAAGNRRHFSQVYNR